MTAEVLPSYREIEEFVKRAENDRTFAERNREILKYAQKAVNTQSRKAANEYRQQFAEIWSINNLGATISDSINFKSAPPSPISTMDLKFNELRIAKPTRRILQEFSTSKGLSFEGLFADIVNRYLDGESLMHIHLSLGIDIGASTLYGLFRQFGVPIFSNSEAIRRSNRWKSDINRIPNTNTTLTISLDQVDNKTFSSNAQRMTKLIEAGITKKIAKRLVVLEDKLNRYNAIEYLKQRYSEGATIAELSKEARINALSLCRLFNKAGYHIQTGKEAIERGRDRHVVDEFGIYRDNRGWVRWKLGRTSNEENLQIGVNNIQGLFLKKFPEFASFFIDKDAQTIKPELHDAAREYVLQKVGLHRDFLKVFGGRFYELSYFPNDFLEVLKLSFKDWGLSFNVEVERTTLSVDGGIEVNALDQVSGLERLVNYFRSPDATNRLEPFILSSVAYIENSSIGEVYVGVIKGKVLRFGSNPEVTRILREGRNVLVVPKQDGRYTWLEFYGIDDSNNAKNVVLSSIRINREAKRFESQSWYGPDKQLIVDYLLGEDIGIQELKSFSAIVTKDGEINIGSIDGNPLKISSSNLHKGQELLILPEHDPLRGYTWVEGHSRQEGENINVFRRRFRKGDKKFQELEWKGPEIQSVLDWCHDILSIDIVDPILIPSTSNHVAKTKSGAYIYLERTITSSFIMSFYRNPYSIEYNVLKLVPKEDFMYKYIEVYQTSSSGELPENLISTYRVRTDRKNKLDGLWPGPQIQRYIDYLNGSKNYSSLEPISAAVSKNGKIYLFSYKGKPICLTTDRTTKTIGDLIVVPFLSENNLGLQTQSLDGFLLKKYIWDEESTSFRAINESDEVISQLSISDIAVANNKTGRASNVWGEGIIHGYSSYIESGGSLSFEEYIKTNNDLDLTL